MDARSIRGLDVSISTLIKAMELSPAKKHKKISYDVFFKIHSEISEFISNQVRDHLGNHLLDQIRKELA